MRQAGREVSNHSHLVLSKGQPPSGGPTHSGYLSREHMCGMWREEHSPAEGGMSHELFMSDSLQ